MEAIQILSAIAITVALAVLFFIGPKKTSKKIAPPPEYLARTKKLIEVADTGSIIRYNPSVIYYVVIGKGGFRLEGSWYEWGEYNGLFLNGKNVGNAVDAPLIVSHMKERVKNHVEDEIDKL